jgi:hypothetical protein
MSYELTFGGTMKQVLIILVLMSVLLFISCSSGEKKEAVPAAGAGKKVTKAEKTVNFIAESYVKLAFHVGKYDKDYVDAYFGPEHLKQAVQSEEKTLARIKSSAAILIEELGKVDIPISDEMFLLRRKNLLRMLQSLHARVEFLEGKTFSFDQESLAIYDAVSPSLPDEHFEAILKELDALLPGKEPLVERVNAYRQQFVIPPDKLDAVFKAAVAEGRKRTKVHIPLLDTEDFILEYVKDKPWGAYNWFKGNAVSLIQVNTDLPVTIDRAIDLACHEGYPGHHVYFCLIEQNLYKEKGWVECSIYPLFSPISLMAEGTANFGIQVAFPGKERVKFEKEVLFPLAGLDPSKADRYYKVQELTAKLSFAGNEAARLFIDGKIDGQLAVERLMKFRMMGKERAEKYLDFIKRYRAYVINYNLGLKMVKEYIEKRGGTDDQPEKRWQEFKKLMSAPLLPSDLK